MNQRRFFSLQLLLAVCVASLNLGSFAQTAPPLSGNSSRPWMDATLSPDQRADMVVAQMTLDEKIQLVHGAGLPGFGEQDPSIVRSNGGGGFVPGIPRLGLPDLNMNDATIGSGGGSHRGRYSTALPSALALASSWNPALATEWGELLGTELANQGYNVSLCGGVDLTREPRNGRNFEYQGEDPVLAGNMMAHLIQGVQAQGVIGDIKHYAMNDEETGRYFENILADKRSMRESDLLAFEIGVKQGKPGMVMCSYNLINGVYACENDYILNQLLKHDWGFQGWVVSDWLATHSTAKAAIAGLDQQQPGGEFFGVPLKKAVENGQVPLDRLNDMVHRIVRTEFAIGLVDHPRPTQVPDIFRGFRVAQHAEEESAVLLENKDRLLPLDAARIKSITVIGSHADVGVLSGGGSAQVDAAGGSAVPSAPYAPGDFNAMLATQVWHRSSPLAAIVALAPDARVTYDSGEDTAAAAKAAAAADVAIVFANQHTHEGNDLPNLSLPKTLNGTDQDKLIAEVVAANPHTIVVLETGGPVTMPWASQVGAILEAWYPGIRGGEAIANLLFGKVNPSGKLAVTFPASEKDIPRPTLPVPPGALPGPLDGIFQPRAPFDIRYDEGLKVGYKWYDSENKQPLFPFGHGLSYTTYSYSELHSTGGKTLSVSFTVQNTGQRAGAEIAQVYLSLPKSAGEPPKRLIAWQKIPLQAGESKTITLDVDPLYLSVFNPDTNRWQILPGEYKVMAGPSSASLPLSTTVILDGDK